MTAASIRGFGTALALVLLLLFRPLEAIADDVVLTVRLFDPTGTIAATTDYTMPQLEASGLAEVLTSTPWTSGQVAFQGVPLIHLTGNSGARELTAIALNDYSVSLPVNDIERYGVILATRMSGKPMAIRDKGPLWIIYPLDGYPELNNQRVHARMVWQVRVLEAR